MHVVPRLVLAAALALVAPALAPLGAQGGRISVGPLVGSAPGADVSGARVPTVGLVGDVGLLGIGMLGLHLGGTYESRAGAGMTGVSASARLPLGGLLALRAGVATGRAEVQRFSDDHELGWRDWRGLDAGLELHLGRTTGALMVRSGTIDQFAAQCAPDLLCAALVAPQPAGRSRFMRVSFESRYALF